MTLCWLLISILPQDDVAEDRVDEIEFNHFFDGDGRSVFDQVIFRQQASDGDLDTVAWRLWKSDQQTPWRDRQRGGCVTIFNDSDRLRVVRSRIMRETWTQHDPELADRERVQPHLRRGLQGERVYPWPEPAR